MKMKMVLYLSFDIKVWDTLFYLPRESNARASCMEKLLKKNKKNWKKKIWRREKVMKIRGEIIKKIKRGKNEKRKQGGKGRKGEGGNRLTRFLEPILSLPFDVRWR